MGQPQNTSGVQKGSQKMNTLITKLLQLKDIK